MQSAFTEFKDTGIYERYMTNIAQFSAAKSYSEARMLQDAVFDRAGKVRSYREFEREATSITDIQQKTWLRVEYETCRRNAISGSKFAQMQEDADLYPYWIYKGRMDGRERPDHVAMEGKIFRIGDPAGDACFPPNDWNCRCVGDPIDAAELERTGQRAQTDKEAKTLLEDNVDEQFRYNAATQGPLPNDHSYMDNFRSANEGNAGFFGDPKMGGDEESLIGLDTGPSMHYRMKIVSEWREKYHVDNQHNIILQNKATFANVRLSDAAIHRIGQHARGFENVPETVESPDEIWTGWEDPTAQRHVLRNYLKFGRVCYIVKTRDGLVTDAFALSRKQAYKYRIGCIL